MNKNLTILIVDDEWHAIQLLTDLLTGKPGVGDIFTASTRKQALDLAVTTRPDLILQDIKMHDADGLALVDEYRSLKVDSEIVFVTAYEQYAIQAIKKAALDYLLKPVAVKELDDMLQRIKAKRNNNSALNTDSGKRLKIPTRDGFLLIDLQDIILFEAEGTYTSILTIDEQNPTFSSNIGAIENQLPTSFVRVSRSTIINSAYIVEVKKRKQRVVLKWAMKELEVKISTNRLRVLENLL